MYDNYVLLQAFVELVAMLVATIFTTIFFYRVNKVAALLLVPYIFWLSFAAALNYAIYTLNMENGDLEPKKLE